MADERGSSATIGYARSISRGGLLELTELFVVPGHQSAGVGRVLLERAFPPGRGDVRSIIATMDMRAQSRYVRAGTAARFPFFSLVGTPHDTPASGGLTAQRIAADSVVDRALLRDMERAVLEFSRNDDEVSWLLDNRRGYLYRRDGEAVGFGFVGEHGVGPIAVLEPEITPAVLLHIEGAAAAAGIKSLDFQVPAPNEIATRHLLSRGFQFDPWVNLLMSSRPFGHFDRFIAFDPPMFL